MSKEKPPINLKGVPSGDLEGIRKQIDATMISEAKQKPPEQLAADIASHDVCVLLEHMGKMTSDPLVQKALSSGGATENQMLGAILKVCKSEGSASLAIAKIWQSSPEQTPEAFMDGMLARITMSDEILQTIQGPGSVSAQKYLDIIQASRGSDELEEALDFAREAIGHYPDNEHLHAQAAEICIELGRTEDALAAYQRALQESTGSSGALYLDEISRLAREPGGKRTDKSDEKHGEEKKGAADYCEEIRVLKEGAAYNSARELVERAIAHYPNLSLFYKEKAVILEAMGEQDEALIVWKQALGLADDTEKKLIQINIDSLEKGSDPVMRLDMEKTGAPLESTPLPNSEPTDSRNGQALSNMQKKYEKLSSKSATSEPMQPDDDEALADINALKGGLPYPEEPTEEVPMIFQDTVVKTGQHLRIGLTTGSYKITVENGAAVTIDQALDGTVVEMLGDNCGCEIKDESGSVEIRRK